MCSSDLDFIRILRVPVRIVAANTAREIADTLQEDDRLPGKKASECVCYWERLEYEEAVGRDPLQHIDLLMLVSAAEFQRVLTTHPSQRSRVVEDVVVGVTRSRDRITNIGITIHLDERWSGSDVETRLVLESKA